MRGFPNSVWDEASSLVARLGFRGPGWIRAVFIYLVLIGVFGVFLPWQKGRDFLDPVMLGAYACLGVVFAAPAAAVELEGGPQAGKRALARVLVCVLYGEVVVAVMLALGVGTIYGLRWGRVVVGPDLRSLGECMVFGLAISLAITTAAVWLSVRFSPGAAKAAVRAVFLALLGAFFLWSGWLPDVALRGAGIALLAAGLFSLRLRAALAGAGRGTEP